MIKIALTTTAIGLAMCVAAAAETTKWSVTETNAVGIKVASGTWTLNNEGGKLSGSANMQFDSGKTLDYKLEGTVEGETYTVNLVDRTDEKKDCVWTGKPAATASGRVLTGDAKCGSSKFTIRAGMQ
jgi:osmotically-inducible protein OsmY